MRLFLHYLKNYKKESILSPAFKLLESLMDLIVPIVVARIIDVGVAGNDRGYVVKCFVILIALALLGILFSFTAQWFAARASVGVATHLRQSLFDHIQGLSFTEYDTLGTDTLITRMTSDINQVQNGINLGLRLLLRSPFIVFGAMIMAFTIDFSSALIFAAAIPLLALVVFGIMLASIPLYTGTQSALDRLLGKTRENMTGVRVIRAFNAQERETAEFDRRNDALTKISERVGRLSALMNPATFLIVNIAVIILIMTGAIRVNAGELKQGDVVALYNYMAQIIVELIKLASLIITLNRSFACGKRIEDIFAVKSSMEYGDYTGSGAAGSETDVRWVRDDGPGQDERSGQDERPGWDGQSGQDDRLRREGPNGQSGDYAVCFENVAFKYAGAKEAAVTELDFKVKRGQTVGIIGPTGCGKTTLVSLIPRFYDATSGRVIVDGRDVRDYTEQTLIDKIGIVPQRAVLFEGSIRDNMKWGSDAASDAEIWEAIETAQAGEIVNGREEGLDAVVEPEGRNFSGGQKQRLTIARALVKKPEILIMDDSSSALDYATDLKVRRAVGKLEGETTVFIVSQRISGVKDADLILVLDDGRLVGKGTHDELLAGNETYREIYYSQFPKEKQA